MTHLHDLPRTLVIGSCTAVLLISALGLALRYGPMPAVSAKAVAAGPCAGASRGKPLVPPAQFRAADLPMGAATGNPSFLKLPAGFTLKHYHGGPTYVYVISGALSVSDAAGTKVYCTGSFFAEPPNHVHTAHALRPTQLFALTLLAPGKQATVPVK